MSKETNHVSSYIEISGEPCRTALLALNQYHRPTNQGICVVDIVGENRCLTNQNKPIIEKENAGAAATAPSVEIVLKARRFLLGHSMVDMTRASEVAS